MATLDGLKMENGQFPAFASPGGYPLFYLTQDNGLLCPNCANGLNGSEAYSEDRGMGDGNDPQWYVVACDVHYEGSEITCDHCAAGIESAYGVPDND